MTNKIFLVIIYIIILILIPIFLEYLFKISVRNKKREDVIKNAKKQSNKMNKPLIIFDGPEKGFIDTNDKIENFSGDIMEIVSQLNDNTCIVIVSEILEYIPDPSRLITELKRISGNDLFVISFEKNSPRIFWDYKIVNVIDKSCYFPKNGDISWHKPNNLQTKTQQLYSYIFKILPYDIIKN